MCRTLVTTPWFFLLCSSVKSKLTAEIGSQKYFLQIYSVRDEASLTHNETMLNYEWRSTTIKPDTNQTYLAGTSEPVSIHLRRSFRVSIVCVILSWQGSWLLGTTYLMAENEDLPDQNPTWGWQSMGWFSSIPRSQIVIGCQSRISSWTRFLFLRRVSGDHVTNSQKKGYGLGVTCLAFIPCCVAFITFIYFIIYFGRCVDKAMASVVGQRRVFVFSRFWCWLFVLDVCMCNFANSVLISLDQNLCLEPVAITGLHLSCRDKPTKEDPHAGRLKKRKKTRFSLRNLGQRLSKRMRRNKTNSYSPEGARERTEVDGVAAASEVWWQPWSCLVSQESNRKPQTLLYLSWLPVCNAQIGVHFEQLEQLAYIKSCHATHGNGVCVCVCVVCLSDMLDFGWMAKYEFVCDLWLSSVHHRHFFVFFPRNKHVDAT